MAELIYLNADGTENKRTTKGKGRPPKGAVKQADGNWIVTIQASQPAEKKALVEYITLDVAGNVTGRITKGRGRTKPGYTLQTDGAFKDNWTKTIVPEAVIEAKPETEVVVTETPTPAAV